MLKTRPFVSIGELHMNAHNLPQPSTPDAQQIKACNTCSHGSGNGAEECYFCTRPHYTQWAPIQIIQKKDIAE